MLKKMVLALALASLTGIAWLGLSFSPAVAASPAGQLTKFDKAVGLSNKTQGASGHKGHHGHHKHHGHKKGHGHKHAKS